MQSASVFMEATSWEPWPESSTDESEEMAWHWLHRHDDLRSMFHHLHKNPGMVMPISPTCWGRGGAEAGWLPWLSGLLQVHGESLSQARKVIICGRAGDQASFSALYHVHRCVHIHTYSSKQFQLTCRP